MNDQCSQFTLQISKDPDTEGLDLQAGQTWIYPTNYPIRDYQYNIIQKALLNNTLVSLPTGLGKTFIAAVIMYNYFRWYPYSKVIFMAPTRPLVKQQVDACYDIMGIPQEVTAELTGTKTTTSRDEIWENKRVFFITPQILQNDLNRILSLGSKIKCLVFDEAHKARGNHAYCEVIRQLQTTNKHFRVLALSATPGGSVNDVLEVIHNLLISHLEFRTEESKDVCQYVFERNLTTMVVPLGDKLQQVRDDYLQILDCYTRTLIKYKVIQGNCANLTKGKIFLTMKNFQQNCRSSPNYPEIMKNLNVCVTLYHGYELLVRHGLRSFATFFEEHMEKPLLRGNNQLIAIVTSVNKYLGPKLKLEPLPDGNFSELSKDIKYGHPKFYKLQEILIKHFQDEAISSRVIVFFEYRDSVMEAYALLRQNVPLLKPRIFLGQKNGITQRSQLNVIKAFRDGQCNILLSTSIGEEGLDVGDVDLIICFDISNKSPIRMVQRMGRTGRKKKGNIIVLVTEGKEQQTLKDCLIHKNNVTYFVLQSTEIAKGLNTNCPKMLVNGLLPRCEKIYITVKKPILKKKSSIKDMFKCMYNSEDANFPANLQLICIEEKIPKLQMLWPKVDFLEKETTEPKKEITSLSVNILSKKISKQRSFQEGHKIKYSKDSEILVSLLQFADAKRFNIPMSQMGTTQNKYFKQTDIRQMFLKSQSANDFDIPSVPAHGTITSSPDSKEKLDLGPENFYTEISSYLSIKSNCKKCRHCPKSIDCEKFTEVSTPQFYSWFELDSSIFTSITTEDINLFKKTLRNPNCVEELEFDDSLNLNLIKLPSQITQISKVLELDDLIDKSIFTDIFDKSVHFEAPKSLNKLLNQYSKSIIDVEGIQLTGLEPSKPKLDFQHSIKQELLTFFMLKDLGEIFDNQLVRSSQGAIIYSMSPDIFGDSPVKSSENMNLDKDEINKKENLKLSDNEIDTSPILGSLKNRTPRCNKPKLQNLKRNFNDIVSPSLFTMNRTKISSTPLSSQSNIKVRSEVPKSVVQNNIRSDRAVESTSKLSDFNDLCDLSMFGITSKPISSQNKTTAESPASISKIVRMSESYNLDDFCQPIEKSIISDTNISFENCEKEKSQEIHNKNDMNNFSLTDLCDTSLFQDFCIQPSTVIINKKSSMKLDISADKSVLNHIGNSVTNLDTLAEIPICKHTQKDSSIDLDQTVANFEPIIKNSISEPNKISKKLSFDLDKTVDDLVPYTMKTFNNDFNKSIKSFVTFAEKNDLNREANSKDSFKVPSLDFNKTPTKHPNATNTNNSLHSKQLLKTQNHSVSQLSITQMISFINKDDSKPVISPLMEQKRNEKTNNVKSTDQLTTGHSPKIEEICEIEDDFFNFTFNNKKSPIINKSNVNVASSSKTILSQKPQVNSKKLFTADKPQIINVSHNQSNSSDEDFEPKSITSPAWIRPKDVIRKTIAKTSSTCNNKRNKQPMNNFIEDEAEVSDNEDVFISGDEDESTLDHYEKSFVADETQQEDTQIHAVYLQSIRSPVINRRQLRRNLNTDVYSQEVNIRPEDETYLDDSFVVDGDVEERDELSQLEILEMQLEHRKKRKLETNSKKSGKRRRRIIQNFSDDDSG